MRNWFMLFEPWLYERLIRSPTFHRGVRAVERQVRQLRYGKDVEEMGGTKLDPDKKGVLKHFLEELKHQTKGLNKDK